MHLVTEKSLLQERNKLLGKLDLCGYEWNVIIDLTRENEDLGLFYGRLFRMMDFVLDRDEVFTWPDGIIFEHTISRNRLTFSYEK
jgi:hypothetical protein